MINAQVVAHSVDPRGNELVSILATFPRIILAEVNTHRMLSKNTSSSRAIPFNKMVEAVRTNPFIPIAWQVNHSGMQGTEYLSDVYADRAKDAWLEALDNAIESATHLNKGINATKQLANRLLEPFMWTTMLITGPRYGGGWDNFFELRCPNYVSPVTGNSYKSIADYIFNEENPMCNEREWMYLNKGQAEIHIMALAEDIYDAINCSIPKQLQPGEWHIPFADTFDIGHFADTNNGIDYSSMVKVSTAMAARTSYTIVGDEKEVDYNKMIGLHDRLIAQNPPHSSPMEHCAQVMTHKEYNDFVKGELYSTILDGENVTRDNAHVKGWCRNYRGFVPYRHIIESGNRI